MNAIKSALFIVLLSLVLGPSYAVACVCKPTTPEVQEESAHAIFIATALGESEKAANGIWTVFAIELVEKETDEAKILLNEIEIADKKRVRIAQKLSECNFIFEQDKIYRIFATIAQSEQGVGYLTTSQCSGTLHVVKAADGAQAGQPVADTQSENKGQ